MGIPILFALCHSVVGGIPYTSEARLKLNFLVLKMEFYRFWFEQGEKGEKTMKLDKANYLIDISDMVLKSILGENYLKASSAKLMSLLV